MGFWLIFEKTAVHGNISTENLFMETYSRYLRCGQHINSSKTEISYLIHQFPKPSWIESLIVMSLVDF
jgi:hypothetical protein